MNGIFKRGQFHDRHCHGCLSAQVIACGRCFFSWILVLILQNLVENKLFLVDVTEPVLKRKYIALQKKVLVLNIPGRLQFAE